MIAQGWADFYLSGRIQNNTASLKKLNDFLLTDPPDYKVLISKTFYEQTSCMKVICTAFFVLEDLYFFAQKI
jgi:hypothetical protein